MPKHYENGKRYDLGPNRIDRNVTANAWLVDLIGRKLLEMQDAERADEIQEFSRQEHGVPAEGYNGPWEYWASVDALLDEAEALQKAAAPAET